MKTYVISAIDLDGGQKQKIETVVTKLFKDGTELHYQVDPKIIGGLVIKHGDHVINASLKARLESLEEYLKK